MWLGIYIFMEIFVSGCSNILTSPVIYSGAIQYTSIYGLGAWSYRFVVAGLGRVAVSLGISAHQYKRVWNQGGMAI